MCMMCMMHAMDHSGHDAQAMPASAPHAEGESLLDILKRRYALGEINREQFEEMRRVLNLGATEAGTEHAGH
jgi:uncharacterized membrane protein